MTEAIIESLNLDLGQLRGAIQEEYEAVADEPDRGFHFHIGRKQAQILGYEEAWLDDLPKIAVESIAGTGNPFRIDTPQPGEHVVDIGSGAGIDSLIAGRMVGPEGRVVGVDMTPAMLRKARRAATEAGLDNVEFREGYGEDLPVEDDWADVVISNGVLNLMPDKNKALKEMARVLRPGGRLRIADILVEREVPDSAKRQIDLWTG
ncbi:MAG TPA: methyltransferase domain-containing protein [Candidatus Sulfomarinibacteraceae bacterium]|nr:methyltransferase domain-containing protein [Candidatus Sulfomarinibacteraceae bacterium]